MFKKILILLLLSTVNAFANAEGNWPSDFKSVSLPKTSWILIVPFVRNNNELIWDKDSEWMKSWIVPKNLDGIKMVAVSGDSEDRRRINGNDIDNMNLNSLSYLAKKYSAPSIGVVVKDINSNNGAVALWVSGNGASWDAIYDFKDDKDLKLLLMESIKNIMSNEKKVNKIELQVSVHIDGVRNKDGITEYLIVSDKQDYIDKISNLKGVEVRGYVYSGKPSIIISITNNDSIEDTFSSQGVRIN